MVLHSLSQSARNTRTSNPNMASSTLKSHPLHNFPLPNLRWGINHPNNHRLRRPGDSVRRSPRNNVDSEFTNSGDEAARHRASPSERKPIPRPDMQVEKSVPDSDSESKILIKFPVHSQKQCADEVAADQNSNGEDAESTPKVWNLRPRRPIHKATKASGGTGMRKVVKAVAQETRSQRPDPTRTRNVTEVKVAEKKQKFSVSLSKDEIEEDIFAMTGSKPSRRPKKRVKNVQKFVDRVFPGLWLDSATVTADLYKVSDAPAKLKDEL